MNMKFFKLINFSVLILNAKSIASVIKSDRLLRQIFHHPISDSEISENLLFGVQRK